MSNNIEIYFTENILEYQNFDNIELRDNNGHIIDTIIKITNNKLVIDPNKDLIPNINYTVSIPKGSVQNNLGNYLQNPFNFTFNTNKDDNSESKELFVEDLIVESNSHLLSPNSTHIILVKAKMSDGSIKSITEGNKGTT